MASSEYDDIIDTEYPFELRHVRMSENDRAAQFSAFQALSGFEEEIHEAARHTEKRVELDELLKDSLNAKLNRIKEKITECPLVQIVYFAPDARKDGGKYITVSEIVKRVDEHMKFVQTISGKSIPIDDIYGLDIIEERGREDNDESP